MIQSIDGARNGQDSPEKHSPVRRSESLKVRRHGRTGVPLITVQGEEDTEARCVGMFTKSDSLDTGLERSMRSDRDLNIVVAPTKLVALEKQNLHCCSKKVTKNEPEQELSNSISNDGTVGEEPAIVMVRRKSSTTLKRLSTGDEPAKVMVRRKSSTSSRRLSTGPTRRLSPVPYQLPRPAERRQSLTSLMDTTDRKRRDSTTAMPGGQSPMSSKHRRVSLTPTPPIPRRRASIKDTLASYVSPSDVTRATHEQGTSYRGGLPFDPDSEELKDAKVETGSIGVSIPVFHIVKDKGRISVTALTSVEEAIHKAHPEVTVLKPDVSISRPESMTSAVERSSILSDKTATMHDRLQSKELAAIAEGESTQPHLNSKVQSGPERKVSIRTNVKRMRENTEDYHNQLNGCRNLGAYASMETLHVLLTKQEAIRCVVDAMNRFQEKEELQLNACASLLDMASASEANCYLIHHNQGTKALANCMKLYSERAQIMRLLLNILGYMSSSDGLAGEMLQHGCHSQVLGAMSQHGEDSSIVKQCLFILGNLVTTEETASQIMLVGGVHTVIDMMNKFCTDPDVMENGCRALGSFAAFDNTCLDVGLAGATKSVLVAMTAYPDNVSILECGSWALACLTTIAATCEEVEEEGGVGVVLNCLESHPREAGLQEYGVRIICNLSSLETTKQSVCNQRVISIVQRMMTDLPEHVELQGHVMYALGQIVGSGECAQEQVVKGGGVRSVISTMKLHPEDNLVQQHGCRILGNLAVNDKLRRQTEELGASGAVIGAMLTLDTVEEIQAYGCMALMNITADFKDNKIRVKNNGGVMALLNCLTNFRSRHNIILSALKTLGNIIEFDEACRQVVEERGLRIVVDILRTYEDIKDIQVFSAVVLCGLSGIKTLSTEDIELIDTTMSWMLSKPSLDADLALFVCMALENLLNTDVGLHVFIAERRLDVLLETMTRYNSHPEILQCCCKMIALLALDVRNDMTTGAVRGVLTIMKSFPHHKDLQIVGCGALSCVMERNPSLVSTVEEDVVSIISTATSHHQEEHRLHAVALMAITNLSQTEPPPCCRQQNEMEQLVYVSMTRFPENLEIQICACNALAACCSSDGQRDSELLEALTYSLRRHGRKDGLHRPLARALRTLWHDRNRTTITKILETSPNLQNVFTAELQEAEVSDNHSLRA